MRAHAAAAALAAAGCALAGCNAIFDPCFGPMQRIRDLRVVAARADPPEVVFEPSARQMQQVRITLLVVDPQSSDQIQASGLLCPETGDKRCPPGSPSIEPVTTGAGTIALMANIAPEVLDAALAADPLRGYGGIRVQADLTVRASFGRVVSASKLLLFTPASPNHLPNRAFEISALSLARPNRAAALLGVHDLLQADVGEVISVKPILVGPDGSNDAAEAYDVIDLAGQPVRLREHISYSFFTTLHGRFLADTAEEPPAGAEPTELVKFQPTLQSAGTMFVVARDGRGSVAWIGVPWLAEERREGRRPSLGLECE